MLQATIKTGTSHLNHLLSKGHVGKIYSQSAAAAIEQCILTTVGAAVRVQCVGGVFPPSTSSVSFTQPTG